MRNQPAQVLGFCPKEAGSSGEKATGDLGAKSSAKEIPEPAGENATARLGTVLRGRRAGGASAHHVCKDFTRHSNIHTVCRRPRVARGGAGDIFCDFHCHYISRQQQQNNSVLAPKLGAAESWGSASSASAPQLHVYTASKTIIVSYNHDDM